MATPYSTSLYIFSTPIRQSFHTPLADRPSPLHRYSQFRLANRFSLHDTNKPTLPLSPSAISAIKVLRIVQDIKDLRAVKSFEDLKYVKVYGNTSAITSDHPVIAAMMDRWSCNSKPGNRTDPHIKIALSIEGGE